MIDSDAESEYATHGAGQGLTCVTGVTLESVNETTEFISANSSRNEIYYMDLQD